jgi:ABC-type uncharacterized transport system involved in gliding motility auxiliary subunit
MISDLVAYQATFFGSAESGDNAALVMNSVEFLGGGRNLIGIRSRGRYSRPFEVVDRIEQEAEEATAARVEALNQQIAEYESKLRQLGSPGTGEQAGLLESEALAERRKIQQEIREARRKLRELNAARRERIEALKARLQFHNLFWAPAAVLLMAVGLGIFRHIKARRYAARRASK